MPYRVYSGPQGSEMFAPVDKDKMLFKQVTNFDEALAWAGHLRRQGRTALLIEGDDGIRLGKEEIGAAVCHRRRAYPKRPNLRGRNGLGCFFQARVSDLPVVALAAVRAAAIHLLIANAQKRGEFAVDTNIDRLARVWAGEIQAFHRTPPSARCHFSSHRHCGWPRQ